MDDMLRYLGELKDSLDHDEFRDLTTNIAVELTEHIRDRVYR